MDDFWLVCALADAPLACAGSTYDRSCSQCGRAVMVARSGQRFLRDHPDAKIRCAVCYAGSPPSGQTSELAGTVEELVNEVATARPNLRRQRN